MANSVISIPDSVSNPKDTKSSKPHKKRSLILRILKWLLIIILSILSLYVVFTITCNIREDNILDEYDNKHSKKMVINGNLMSYDIVGGNNNNTIVLLNGMGSPSPIIEFKPLAEALSDRFKVITLEPFGYGFSDRVETNRTMDNSIAELRECTKKLGVDKYYLMGHSMGGIFALEWATNYSNEILGVVGLDTSVSGTEDLIEHEELFSEYDKMKLIYKTGIQRVVLDLNSSMLPLDFSYHYTEEEIDIEKYLTINRSFSKASLEDVYQFFDNLKKLKGVRYPDTIPIIHFLSGDNVKQDALWEKFHYDTLGNNTRNEVVVLDGPHYIHYPQKDAIVKKIKEWIN